MSLEAIIDRLINTYYLLHTGIDIVWQYPLAEPAAPLSAEPDATWPVAESVIVDQVRRVPGARAPLQVQAKNWFYADVVFPEAKFGVELAGTAARFFINGWNPFTLWLDGKELYREEHAWHAAGPIADPFPLAIEPGKHCRLVICLEPTAVQAGYCYPKLSVEIKLTACTTIAEELAAAAAQLQYAQALASTADERALVARAAACLDMPALEAQQWAVVLDSIASMEDTLLPLSPRAKALTMHLVGHTHLDMDWMWTWPETVQCIRRDFKAAVELLRDYPQLRYTHSQVPTYQVVEQMDPEIFARVQDAIAQGRWENAAGTWVEGDLNLADGESLIRQISYAKAWTREHLGTEARVFWAPDAFSHPASMPQLARLGEFDCYFHWRCNPGRTFNWPIRSWVGVDGTPMTTFSLGYGGFLDPHYTMHNVLQFQRFGFRNGLMLYGVCDHGGSLPRYQLDEVLGHYQHKPLMPTFRFSTMAEMLGAVQQEGAVLPCNVGETYATMEGCFTTHASIKRYNRRCEAALLSAETLCALPELTRHATSGTALPAREQTLDALREAWLPVLFNQFHDILAGAAVHETYDNAHARAENSLAAAARITEAALAALVDPVEGGETLVLVNPLGFARTEPVRVNLPSATTYLLDSAGTPIFVQAHDDAFIFIAENLPAFSCTSYRIMHTPLPTEEAPLVLVQEHGAHYRVETTTAVVHLSKQSGAMTAFYEKTLGRELLGRGVRADLALNLFQLLDETPNEMAAWEITGITRETSLLRGAEVTLVAAGPVFAQFTVKHTVRSSTIEEQVLFYQAFPRVDFVAEIDWREQGSPETGIPHLKVAFAPALSTASARYEGPFCINERPTDGMEQPTQKWATLCGETFGYTVLNDSKYGCDALGGRLRMSLLRTAYIPDPSSDHGRYTIAFAFLPHAASIANAEVVRAGMAFNRPTLAVRTDQPLPPATSLLRISGTDTVVCTALRQAEHSPRLLLRLFETSGTRCQATLALGDGVRSAEEVNFLERPVGTPLHPLDGSITVSFRPFEVKTLLVETHESS